MHPNFPGQLPPTTRQINEALSRYHTLLLIGEKVDSFTYDGLSALPSALQVIQIAPAANQLGFDFPCDMAVLGDIRATLDALATALGAGRADRHADGRRGGAGCALSRLGQASDRCADPQRAPPS